MNNSISFLLGAGFSAPVGYPTGDDLNNELLNLLPNTLKFSTGGRLLKIQPNRKLNSGNLTRFDFAYRFCLDLIRVYDENVKKFDYEEFFDYIVDEAINDINAKKIAKPHMIYDDFEQLVYDLRNIFNQLVLHFLNDKYDNKWYEDQTISVEKINQDYLGIIRYFQSIDKDTTVNINTLNHDLFFESFNNIDAFSGEFCDGFQELGSPYYGNLTKEGQGCLCRLQCYTGEYDKRFRLFKLHGSRDYVLYSRLENGFFIPENYVKLKKGIGIIEIYKEISTPDGRFKYGNCWVNYHSDFLTGTTKKIEFYEDPILYKKLFELFKSNLQSADKLIIIGYGAKDSRINEMIMENFDYKNKKSFIIDPCYGEKVKDLSSKINAKIVSKQLNAIENNDLE